jgi:hypothetical protein
MKFATTIMLSLGVEQAQAWWGTGHLLTARVAFDLLEKESPSALKAAEDVLSLYKKNTNEGQHAFVECSTYADDVKGKGGSYQAGWHFVDKPYLDEPGTKLSDFDFKFDKHDILETLTNIQMIITKESGYETTY